MSSKLTYKKYAILGGGIIGLSTAIRLIEVLKDEPLDITIIADKFDLETTSDGAGGLFRPDDRFMKGVPQDVARYLNLKIFDQLDLNKNSFNF